MPTGTSSPTGSPAPSPTPTGSPTPSPTPIPGPTGSPAPSPTPIPGPTGSPAPHRPRLPLPSREPQRPLDVGNKELIGPAAKIRAEAFDLAEAIGRFIGELEGLGDFWGDDDAGRMFYDGADGRPGYRTRQETAVPDAIALVSAYERTAEGLERMAAHIKVADFISMIALPKVPK